MSRPYDAIATYYHMMFPYREDLAFWAALASGYGEPILEIACGTGRVACHLASLGLKTTGIDLSATMLSEAARRASELKAVNGLLDFQQHDMRDFRLDRKFRLIIAPFSCMGELGEPHDRVRAYRCCLAHLANGGAFVVDCSFHGRGPDKAWGRQIPSDVLLYRGTFPDPEDPHSSIQILKSEKIDETTLVEEMTFLVDHIDAEGHVRRATHLITLHFALPEQTRAELLEAGFTNVEVFGGYGREPLYAPSLMGKGRQIFFASR
jgi:SAM-dependent methyltransferase